MLRGISSQRTNLFLASQIVQWVSVSDRRKGFLLEKECSVLQDVPEHDGIPICSILDQQRAPDENLQICGVQPQVFPWR
jgi:hypothetical protein